MRLILAFLLLTFCCSELKAQETFSIKGKVLDNLSKGPLKNAVIVIEGTNISDNSSDLGDYELSLQLNGDFIVNISITDYDSKRIPVSLEDQNLDLGSVYLERNLSVEQTDNLITLTDSELFDDEVSSNSSGLLQATRDVFLNRAAFDFGQAFFRVRGYDSQNGSVSINGIPMNKIVRWSPTME